MSHIILTEICLRLGVYLINMNTNLFDFGENYILSA